MKQKHITGNNQVCGYCVFDFSYVKSMFSYAVAQYELINENYSCCFFSNTKSKGVD